MRTSLSISIYLCITLVAISCSERIDDKEIISNNSRDLCLEEIAEYISRDMEFVAFSKKNRELLGKVKNKYYQDNLSVRDLDNKVQDDILRIFNVERESVEIQIGRIEEIIHNYALQSLDEEQLNTVLSLSARILSKEVQPAFPEKEGCKEAFEQAFHNIHFKFDTTLMGCVAGAIYYGFIGAKICALGATAKAIIEMAIAIDNHTRCRQNETNATNNLKYH